MQWPRARFQENDLLIMWEHHHHHHRRQRHRLIIIFLVITINQHDPHVVCSAYGYFTALSFLWRAVFSSRLVDFGFSSLPACTPTIFRYAFAQLRHVEGDLSKIYCCATMELFTGEVHSLCCQAAASLRSRVLSVAASRSARGLQSLFFSSVFFATFRGLWAITVWKKRLIL